MKQGEHMYFRLFIKTIFIIAMMQISTSAYAEEIWIDVRSAEEYASNNIEGDVRITHVEIVKGVASLIPDKNTEIYLYCRSGRRANVALSALNKVGYTHVTNVGSIENARKARGLNQ